MNTKNANLKCRMVESPYPENNSLVMARVDKIHSDGVSVTLLEYNDRVASILVANDPDCLSFSKEGRIEPLRVLFVDKKHDYIALKRSGTTFVERMGCEQLYNKRKHVHSVLYSVADDEGMDLEKLYQMTHWPSYEALPTLHEQVWLKKEIKDRKLRSVLVGRIELMQYFSWKIEAPWILNLCYFISKLSACYAYSLVRQLEAILKLKQKLPHEDYLSFQDFINKVPKRLFRTLKDGTKEADVRHLDRLAVVLEKHGVVRKELSPMTHSLDDEPIETDGEAFKVREMKVHFDITHRKYEEKMLRRLKRCPLTASVLWWESYYGIRDDRIFTPTEDEVKEFHQTDCSSVVTHVMLMSGHGVDRYGRQFLEFQDSDGDVNNGDRGYVRIAQVPNPVVDYVTMKL